MLDRRVVAAAYFHDSYRVPVRRLDATVVDLYFAVFGHLPGWMQTLLIVRNFVASLGGLVSPTMSEILHVGIKDSYAVGDKMGVWPIHHLSGSEVVVGRDNKHMDFRLSVLRLAVDGADNLVVSTVCTVHNRFGKVYLFFIVPFHKWGLKRLMSNAVRAARL